MHTKDASLPVELRRALDRGSYDAVLVAYRDSAHYLGYAYYPKSSIALQGSSDVQYTLQPTILTAGIPPAQRSLVDRALHFPFTVHSLNTRFKNEADQIFSQGMVYFLLVILYVAVIAYGMSVAQGVIEEKANRIMEVMIGAVRPSQLLAGKIFGISAVALLQLTINAAAAAVAAVVAGVLYGGSEHARHAAASTQQQAMMQRVVAEGVPHIPWTTLGFLSFCSLNKVFGVAS